MAAVCRFHIDSLSRADILVVVDAELIVYASQVAAREVLLVTASAALEHHFVQHLVVFLRVARQVRRGVGAQMRQIHRVRRQGVVKVARALLIPNAAGFAIVALAVRLVEVVVVHRVGAWNGERFGHDGRLRRHGSEAAIFVGASERVSLAQVALARARIPALGARSAVALDHLRVLLNKLSDWHLGRAQELPVHRRNLLTIVLAP